MTFDALLENVRHASTNWRKVKKTKISLIKLWSCIVILMYIILLNKLRFD